MVHLALYEQEAGILLGALSQEIFRLGTLARDNTFNHTERKQFKSELNILQAIRFKLLTLVSIEQGKY